MRLNNKRLSRNTSFSNLSRDTQQHICEGISQGFKEDYKRDVPTDKITKVFILYGVEVSVYYQQVELIRDHKLLQAFEVLLKN